MCDLDAAVIVALRNATHYLTLSDLERICSASGEMILAAIEDLLERGYRIEGVPGEGYRLLAIPQSLDGANLRALARTKLLGREILTFGRIGSTNDVAIALARSGASEGTLVVAEEQTSGRGRLGRNWYSPAGKGLWFSIVLKPSLLAEEVVTISLAAALGVAEVLRDRYGIPAELKWPNDIVVRSRKICGILTEGDFLTGEIESVVVGIGINVLNTPDDFPQDLKKTATSVWMETGIAHARSILLTDLLEGIEIRYEQLCKRGFNYLKHDVMNISSLIGKLVRVVTPRGEIVGTAHDIEDDGALVIRKENGAHERVIAGEVSRLS